MQNYFPVYLRQSLPNNVDIVEREIFYFQPFSVWYKHATIKPDHPYYDSS